MKTFHIYLYGPNCGPITTSFEQATVRLQQLTQLHFEPDGSFVLSREHGVQQVFGMLYDAGGVLQYVELRGACTLAIWRDLVGAIRGDAEHDLAVMMLPERQLKTLQSFENLLRHWSAGNGT